MARDGPALTICHLLTGDHVSDHLGLGFEDLRQGSRPEMDYVPEVIHQRQYPLKDRAVALSWSAEQIRVLDADLGQSGTQMLNRQDFKTLVADVSLEKVGAPPPPVHSQTQPVHRHYSFITLLTRDYQRKP